MNPLVQHIVSGHAFFTGIALILSAVFLSTRQDKSPKRFAPVTFIVAVLAIVLSSTPIPYWYYAIAAALTIWWLVALRRPNLRRRTNVAMVIVWLGAAAMELPWHFLPHSHGSNASSLTVVGDSVSAGLGDQKEDTWPALLAQQHQVGVQDLSHVGETAGSALKRAQSCELQSKRILLEIGGNDILGTTTTAEFERDLDALLAFLKTPDREVLMFELPLPPLYHEYGRIQRMLAERHLVKLIPKRVFLSSIAEGDSTLDSIHLSQAGHQRMADLVWELIR